MSTLYGFERDAYLRHLDVKIVETGREDGRSFVLLDDTILYPGGGGQPADRGWLAETPVVDVQRSGGALRHFVEARLGRGEARLILDWQRRYDHMQQHTAQHLLTSLALQRFGWETRSFHIGPELSDIELGRGSLSVEEIEALEEAVSQVIGEARSVRTFRVEPEEYARLEVRSRGLPGSHSGSLRLVEIEGLDLNTCGGTHVRCTAEVGAVKIVGTEAIRDGCRLRWVAGTRMRRRLGTLESREATLRSLLDTGSDELAVIVRLKLDQLGRARREQRRLEHRLAQALAERLLTLPGAVVDSHLEEPDARLLRKVAEQFVERAGSRVALLTATSELENLFALAVGAQSPIAPREAGEQVARLLGGRGGGSGRIFQGKAASLRHRSKALAHLQALLSQ